ncbi:unnamed protein product [Trichogramma brassicae]|uniref:Uncharacterized protein n=1 Tax=Trichogramma brassicae TaxID=86971 RepID=A0A6H5IK21_9HYME|nr:unnamed protein product [Trichogramma brassicae]
MSCVIPGCSSSYSRDKHALSFFRFHVKDSKIHRGSNKTPPNLTVKQLATKNMSTDDKTQKPPNNRDKSKDVPSAKKPTKGPPEWFAEFDQRVSARLDHIDERLDTFAQRQHDQDVAIATNTAHIAELNERLSSELREIQQRHTEDGQALAEIREEVARLATAAAMGAVNRVAGPSSSTGCLEDCEVRLSGIPAQLHPCDRSTVERVLTALEERELLPHVLRIREWNVKRRAPTTASGEAAAPSSSPATVACVIVSRRRLRARRFSLLPRVFQRCRCRKSSSSRTRVTAV